MDNWETILADLRALRARAAVLTETEPHGQYVLSALDDADDALEAWVLADY